MESQSLSTAGGDVQKSRHEVKLVPIGLLTLLEVLSIPLFATDTEGYSLFCPMVLEGKPQV